MEPEREELLAEAEALSAQPEEDCDLRGLRRLARAAAPRRLAPAALLRALRHRGGAHPPLVGEEESR